ncbi:MAG: ABC transporter permease [Verrucomicrobia bacterium]|nr:ABC transporter permease [Verrucomicrobiota bacterium]
MTATAANSAALAAKPQTLWSTAWRQFRRNRLAAACLWIIVIYVGIWLYAESVYWTAYLRDVVPSYKVTDFDARNAAPSLRHWLGTDFTGRDNVAQLIQGVRIAFEIAILSSAILIPLGFLLGALAGYFGRWVDNAIIWLYSVVDSVPSILSIISISYVVGRGMKGIVIGMGLVAWVGLCRLIRGEYLKHKQRAYVAAARALGAGHLTVMLRHIAPNVLHIVIITFTLLFPRFILTEVILSYLGVGIANEPSWGVMINDAKQRLWLGVWWELGGATAAMFFLVLALNIVGDALRDALDPKLKTAEGSAT